MTRAEGTDTGYSLIGVVSFGDGCGVPNKYAVSTEFSNYLDWVADQFSLKSRSSTKHTKSLNLWFTDFLGLPVHPNSSSKIF